MEKNIFEVKIDRKKGTWNVRCPLCQREHYGNALEGFFHSKTPMPCRDNETGCKAVLLLTK